jgi:hypothetical protein
MPQYLTANEISHCLTAAESLAFESSTDPAVVIVRVDLFTVTDAIDINHVDFIAAVGVLQTAGILTSERAAAVLRGERVR